jgi:1,4-alpha-glucan branching enzyme
MRLRTTNARHALFLSLLFLDGLTACRTPSRGAGSATLEGEGAADTALTRYEQTRIRGLAATKSCGSFQAQEGITVTRRDAQGKALEGKIRVLVDNPASEIFIVAGYNEWGAAKTEEDRLRRVDSSPYYEGKIRSLSHKMEYRLLVNGAQLLDPASPVYSTASFREENGHDPNPAYLNSVFWDFERPDAYRLGVSSVDLREKPLIIAEGEVMELARKWKANGPNGHTGPTKEHDTYRFVAESGLVGELASAGYNAVEFLPFNASMDGDHWHFRYQVYGLFAPDSRYGNPDEFAMMIDAFNRAGIAVIMDSVVGHYPYQGNEGLRALGPIGLHKWKKADGKAVFGQVASPWGTNRYDYANRYVRRFLTDSIVSMMCRYGISGIRFDNLDGIRLYEGPGGGGPEFLKELMTDVRAYRPESVLIAEMFFGYDGVMKRMDQGGFGVGFRTHSDYFDFLKDNMQKPTEQVDMGRLRTAIRGPYEWKEAPRVQYPTNHDEAANRRDGATGAYLASLLDGGGAYYTERKTAVFGALTMLSGSAYLDMPQMRLLQTGSFNDNSAVEWSLKGQDRPKKVYKFFADLSKLVRDEPAFAFKNYDADIENHVDTSDGRRIISLRRKDQATGKTFYALVNLGHVGITNYQFGVDATGSFRLALDSDATAYGGSGQLETRLASGAVQAEGEPRHGKAKSMTVPYLAPYGVVVLAGP